MVKKKKHLLLFLFIVLLISSWLISAIVVIIGNKERNQNILLQQAQQLLDDKLYMRSIAKYQEAVQKYDTEKNSEIESRILQIYREAGKNDEYYDLIEDRIEEHKAKKEEYLELAGLYTDNGNINRAIEVLKEGIKQYDDEQIKAAYEEVRYGIKELETNISEVKAPGTDWYLPYLDSGLWGYTDSSSNSILEAKYDEALPFSGKYAVVKLEGVYTLIDSKGDWYAVDKTGLEEVTSISGSYIVGKLNGRYGIYTNTFVEVTGAVYENAVLSSNGLCFVRQNGKWGIINVNGEKVTDFIYKDIAVNSHNEVFSSGYAVVSDEDGYFIINEAGKELNSIRYADAKGMEDGWLAVADKNGKWGYTDGIHETVITYQYDDAFSFSDEVGAVKRGECWGYISKNNELVIEAKYEYASPFFQGKSVVKQMGLNYFLTLQYYEYF